MTESPLKHPSALIPIGMSCAALAVTVGYLLTFGVAAAKGQPDEGTPAHIFQLLIAGQVPVIAFFAAKWLPRAPRQSVIVLLLQLGAALAAMSPVYWFGL